MCLIILALEQHPDWPLLIAANRDEHHQRPSRAAAPWVENSAVLGGRDEVSGGSWLACGRGARWAAVTNDPGVPLPAQAESRGRLVGDYLLNDWTPARWAAAAFATRHRFAGFHLLAGQGTEVWYTSNRPGNDSAPRRLMPGYHGLANRGLNSECVKVVGGKRALRRLLQCGPTAAQLLKLLRDERVPPGVYPSERARLVAPRFIRCPVYGTRASTAVMLGRDGSIALREQSFDAAAQPLTLRAWSAGAISPSTTEEVHWHGHA